MSDLVVIAFPTEAKAEEVRQKLLTMQKDYLIELGDAVVAVKESNGHIKLNQLVNTTAAGAVSGTFWGALIGLIFLMPLVGAALGAASGTERDWKSIQNKLVEAGYRRAPDLLDSAEIRAILNICCEHGRKSQK